MRAQKKEKVRRTGYRRVIDYPRTGRSGWRALLPSWRLVGGGLLGCVVALIGLVLIVYANVKVPDINALKMPTATVYEYSDGTVFYAAGLQDRQLVPITRVPETMQHAIVSIENPTFYSDAGIAPKGILRALVSDVQGGEFEGGSTITQQFVKNAYLTDNPTFTRKLVEIFKAVKITATFPKTEILDDYLNTVYFGRGSYGIEAAAETYFGVPVDQITDPARAAYLAALVNEPTVLSQTDPTSQQLLKARWALVLKAMVKAGQLTPAQLQAAVWPTALPLPGAVSYDANGVDDSAMAQVADTYLDKLHQQDPAVPSSAAAHAGGDVIRTTFNQADMTAAVRTVKSDLYERLNPKSPGQAAVDKGVQVGLASVDTHSGELLAFYPGSTQYDNATQAQIEPGSQMSAFATAAQLGAAGSGQSGSMTAALGEGGGDSASASQLWSLMGKVGLTQNLEANPTELPEPLAKLRKDQQLGLGIAPESPARMAAAYAVFADGGVYHELSMALSVTVNGRTVWHYRPQGSAAMSADTAATITGLLASQGAAPVSNSAVPPGPAALSAVGGDEHTAGESGTIGGDASAWYSGYTTDIVTTVGLWDYRVDPKGRTVVQSLDHLGGLDADLSVVFPTDIWQDYMKSVTGGRSPAFPNPPASVGGAASSAPPVADGGQWSVPIAPATPTSGRTSSRTSGSPAPSSPPASLPPSKSSGPASPDPSLTASLVPSTPPSPGDAADSPPTWPHSHHSAPNPHHSSYEG
ncbi:transglycosylase domain-containing protein [Streptacidiphilus sp. P02-A3a]|uniref:transglycosylase domain-containing protein n=1 Tax=Streptacidiphilus sp. P02-A3a TaxID=2704468 RepID=UPI0015FE6D08|nr:transglycosylase domain-containing protein [Streptacidiphilus sp. P02-A3a]QMU71435.1 hypothetical protein GXP74_27580 [Streptacidiphilus sp. P02-A3a]